MLSFLSPASSSVRARQIGTCPPSRPPSCAAAAAAAVVVAPLDEEHANDASTSRRKILRLSWDLNKTLSAKFRVN